MEKKKEKIMLMSLQRRQRQEEDKARKELDLMQRREREREKEEEKIRKKEEQVAKRAAILEQHRLKKAIEEAEREVGFLCVFFEMFAFVNRPPNHFRFCSKGSLRIILVTLTRILIWILLKSIF